jgi:hypothetical protein
VGIYNLKNITVVELCEPKVYKIVTDAKNRSINLNKKNRLPVEILI